MAQIVHIGFDEYDLADAKEEGFKKGKAYGIREGKKLGMKELADWIQKTHVNVIGGSGEDLLLIYELDKRNENRKNVK